MLLKHLLKLIHMPFVSFCYEGPGVSEELASYIQKLPSSCMPGDLNWRDGGSC